MKAKDRIKEALKSVYEPAYVGAGQIYKGYNYDGHFAGDGWWFEPFARTPIYLGTSVNEALEIIEQIKSAREIL